MIYLDNAATTEPKFYRNGIGCDEYWFNSNTPYAKAEGEALGYAEAKIKGLLNVTGGHVLYFRCATEAIEWLANKFCVDEVWCSPYEHDSVYNVSEVLNNKSKYSIQEYSLYCHQLVNQITGDIWDIKEAKEEFVTKPNQFFGVDLTAAIGHTLLPNNLEEYCDALWFSGHKFYTEKNMGAMWISNRLGEYLGASKDPKNQYNLVHGTVDVAGALMLANAMELASGFYACNESYYRSLVIELSTALFNNNIGHSVISEDIMTKVYAINAVYLPNINADALQTYLASKDIYIGVAHSACAGTEDYRVLEAMGINKETASQTIRVSFGVDSSYDDIKGLVNEIKKFKELF